LLRNQGNILKMSVEKTNLQQIVKVTEEQYNTLSSGGTITGAQNTSGSWRKHMDSISRSWVLEWKNIGSADYTSISFKPIILGFKYQGRSYRNGKTDCPVFDYKVNTITIEWDEVTGNSTKTQSKTHAGTNGSWRTQLKYTTGNGGNLFANSDSGSTYIDYMYITLPKLTTKEGTYINRVKISFSANMDGDNDSSVWTTCGDIFITSLNTGATYNESSTLNLSNQLSSVSTGINFMKVIKYKRNSDVRTVICADGIMIGKSATACGKLKWNDAGGTFDIYKGKIVT
jgi:hypothetical protein